MRVNFDLQDEFALHQPLSLWALEAVGQLPNRPEGLEALYALDVLTVIPIMFMGLVLPLLVKARTENNPNDWNRILQKAFDFMAILAMPLIAGAVVVGRDLMVLFAGDGFAEAGPLLVILIIAYAAVFFGSMFGHAVIAVKKQKQIR